MYVYSMIVLKLSFNNHYNLSLTIYFKFALRSRGDYLLGMINLDVVSYDHLDLPPIRYFLLGFTSNKVIFTCNSYLSHRIVNSFLQIVKSKIVLRISVLLAPKQPTKRGLILVFFFSFEENFLECDMVKFFSIAQNRLKFVRNQSDSEPYLKL